MVDITDDTDWLKTKEKQMKELPIPKRVKVGSSWYSVDVVETMQRRGHMGGINYNNRKIEIGRKSNVSQRNFKLGEMKDSFWHEMVHAILRDMGEDTLNEHEKFVTAFANRLTKAIDSARF